MRRDEITRFGKVVSVRRAEFWAKCAEELRKDDAAVAGKFEEVINLYKLLNQSNAPVEREFAKKRRLDEATMAACNYDREDQRMRVTLLGPKPDKMREKAKGRALCFF